MPKVAITDLKYQGDSERGRLGIKSYLVTIPKSSTAPVTIEAETANLGAGSVVFTVNLTNAAIDYTTKLEVSNDNVVYTGIARKALDGTETPAGNADIAKGSAFNLIVSYADYPRVMAMRFFKLTLTPKSAPSDPNGDVFPVYVVQK